MLCPPRASRRHSGESGSRWVISSLPRPIGTFGVAIERRRCYLFELICVKHRHLVSYPKDTIILHGARDLDKLSELDPCIVAVSCAVC